MLQGRTCLYFSVPLIGHVKPSLTVLRRLTAEGCRVLCYTDADFAEKIAECGAEPILYKTDLDRMRSPLPTRLLPITRILGELAAEVAARDFADADQLACDFILHDYMAPWGRVLAQRQGVPSISVHGTIILSSASVHRAWLEFAASLPGYAADCIRFGGGLWRLHRQMKRSWGYAVTPRNLFNGSFFNLVLVPSFMQPGAKAFGPRYLFCSSVKPPAGDFGVSDAGGSKPSNRALSTCRAAQAYLSLRTLFNENVGLLKRAAQALSTRFARVIVSTGGRDTAELAGLPSHVEVHRYVDQSAVLATTDLFISHAGMNSILEALAHRVPLLLVPQMFEQSINARTLELLGAGIHLGRSPSLSALQKGIANIMSNAGVPVRLDNLHQQMQRDDLKHLIEKLNRLPAGKSTVPPEPAAPPEPEQARVPFLPSQPRAPENSLARAKQPMIEARPNCVSPSERSVAPWWQRRKMLCLSLQKATGFPWHFRYATVEVVERRLGLHESQLHQPSWNT